MKRPGVRIPSAPQLTPCRTCANAARWTGCLARWPPRLVPHVTPMHSMHPIALLIPTGFGVVAECTAVNPVGAGRSVVVGGSLERSEGGLCDVGDAVASRLITLPLRLSGVGATTSLVGLVTRRASALATDDGYHSLRRKPRGRAAPEPGGLPAPDQQGARRFATSPAHSSGPTWLRRTPVGLPGR
jgi:hypothetical protein